jgi:hypothetical protein
VLGLGLQQEQERLQRPANSLAAAAGGTVKDAVRSSTPHDSGLCGLRRRADGTLLLRRNE